ncbi:uncharacterized protein J3R85_007074 [Psidium guajava]|nr:uncharacterized protein J3R85_007074 [Psidium guajava]
MDTQSAPAQRSHAVCIPGPYQSHIGAMLKLAKLLYTKGFCISFVNTEYNHRRLLKSRGPRALDGFSGFRFLIITDGLPPQMQTQAETSWLYVILSERTWLLHFLISSPISTTPHQAQILLQSLASSPMDHVVCHQRSCSRVRIPIVSLVDISACAFMDSNNTGRLGKGSHAI